MANLCIIGLLHLRACIMSIITAYKYFAMYKYHFIKVKYIFSHIWCSYVTLVFYSYLHGNQSLTKLSYSIFKVYFQHIGHYIYNLKNVYILVYLRVVKTSLRIWGFCVNIINYQHASAISTLFMYYIM